MIMVSCGCFSSWVHGCGRWEGQATAARRPPSPSKPWTLIVYSDEISPGNNLKVDNRRQLQGVYHSFLEFGPAALAKEDFWLCASVLRSITVRKIEWGMSAVMAALPKTFFSAGSHNMKTAGLGVSPPGGGKLRIFARFGCKLADESALHQVWLCKGANGTKMRVQCANNVDPDWPCPA